MNPIPSSIRRTLSPFNSSPLGAQPRRKTGVIAELSDSLRDVEIAKNDRKRLYDAGVQATQQKENMEKETTRRLEIRTTSEVEKMRIQTNRELELRRLMLEERRLAIQERQLGIIPIPSHPYTAASNSYASSQSSFNTAPSKPYMARHISSKWNLDDEVSGNDVEDEVSGDVGMESMDYERD